MPLVLNGTTGVNTDGQGNLTFSGTGQRIVGDFSNATLASRVYFQNTTSAQTALGVLPGSGFAIAAVNIFSQSDPANSALLQMRIENTVDARISSGVTGTGSFVPMTFYTGGSERMRLDTSGNLGIGTSSPSHRLQVAGSGTITSFVGTTDTSGTAVGRFRATYAGGGGGTASAVDLRAGDGYTYLLTESNVPMLFGTNNTERMRIDSAGNVGIGTNSPGTRLQVASGTSSTAVTVSNTSGGSEWQQAGSDLYISNYNASGAAIFRTNGAERMRIDSSGNVGIGTTVPGQKLDVDGNIQVRSTNQIGFFNQNYFIRASTGLEVQSFDLVRFLTNGANERMRIDSAGNVGIGTSSPTVRLQVNGRIAVVDENVEFRRTGQTSWNVTNFGSNLFFNNGSDRMVLDSSGNLLVGTTSASGGITSNTGIWRFASVAPDVNPGFIQHIAGGVAQFQSFGNGNTFNTNGVYGSFSDAKLKENIVDTTPKLSGLMQVRVVNYNLVGATQKQIGVIAQELEQIFPGMVEESHDRDEEGKDLGTTTKSVKYSVFVPMLIKAIQEQQAIIEQLKADVAALKGTA